MPLHGRWLAASIAALAMAAPATALGADAPIARIAVTNDARTAGVFADSRHLIIRGGFDAVGVKRGDAVIADRTGVREIRVGGEVQDAESLGDRFVFALPHRLVLLGPHGRRRAKRAPWSAFAPQLRRCGPWICFSATRADGRLQIGAVDRNGRLRWRRVVAAGDRVVADADTIVVVRDRRLARFGRRDGRGHGTLTVRAAPLGVLLRPGRIVLEEVHANHILIEAYARSSASLVATASFRLSPDGTPFEVGLTTSRAGLIVQGPLERSGGEQFDALVLSRGLRVRRVLHPLADIIGQGDLMLFDQPRGTLRTFDPVTGRAGRPRQIAMETRRPFIATGPAGAAVWGDYGSPRPAPAAGLATVDLATGVVRDGHLADDDTNLIPLLRTGGRTWTEAAGDLVGIDDHGGTVTPPVSGVAALAAAADRVYAVAGIPGRLVAVDAASGAPLPFAVDVTCTACVAVTLAADAAMVILGTADEVDGVIIRAFDPVDAHLLFQRKLPVVPFGIALGPTDVRIVGPAIDGNPTSSVEVVLGRDGAIRPGGLRLAGFYDDPDTPATPFGVFLVSGRGQVVVGDLVANAAAARGCGAVLTDLAGRPFGRWRPCLPATPFSVAGIDRRVAIGYEGGLDVYDLP